MNTPDQWRRWLRSVTPLPEDRLSVAFAAVDAYETLLTNPVDEIPAVDAFVKAASSPYKLVAETGCGLLFRLAEKLISCQEGIVRMARDNDATARFNAVAYLHRTLPKAVLQFVVGIALSDRSAKIRAKAVQMAEELRLVEYLAQLEAMLVTEKSANVLRNLEFHFPLLKDGFFVTPKSDGTGYEVTIRGTHSIGGSYIPMNLYSESYVREVVERYRKDERS